MWYSGGGPGTEKSTLMEKLVMVPQIPNSNSNPNKKNRDSTLPDLKLYHKFLVTETSDTLINGLELRA